MPTATARNVDEKDYLALVDAASENGRSVSEELRRLIAEHARKRRASAVAARLKEFRERHPIKLPPGKTSLDLLRDERDSW